MPTLTVEQSKLGALRSAEARRANALELETLRKRVKEFESALPAKPIVQPHETVADILARTREHIIALDKLIADCVDPKEWDCLTRSREREWRIFAHCSNLPGPGNLKPSSPKQSRSLPLVQPVALPTPEPNQSSQ